MKYLSFLHRFFATVRGKLDSPRSRKSILNTPGLFPCLRFISSRSTFRIPSACFCTIFAWKTSRCLALFLRNLRSINFKLPFFFPLRDLLPSFLKMLVYFASWEYSFNDSTYHAKRIRILSISQIRSWACFSKAFKTEWKISATRHRFGQTHVLSGITVKGCEEANHNNEMFCSKYARTAGHPAGCQVFWRSGRSKTIGG